MRRAWLAVLLLAAACGGASHPRPRAAAPAPLPAVPPPESALEPWRAPGVEPGKPLPLPDGRSATVLLRRTGDQQHIALRLERDGQVTDLLPIADVAVGGVRHREVLAQVAPFERFLRVDVRLFENVAPRYFAVKTALVDVSAGNARVVLERLVESGNDVLDRHATLRFDGADVLLVEERESAGATRRLRYVRGPDGTFSTDDPSLFADPG